MIVLHGAMDETGFVLWGETAGGVGTDAEELVDSLRRAGVNLKPRARQVKEYMAWLPTLGGRPLFSLGLEFGPGDELPAPPPKAEVTLAPWPVTARLLSPAETVGLLRAARGKRTLVHGVIVGADLAYWSEVLRLAGSLVARQRFLPGLASRNGKWSAVWNPVFIGSDAERLVRLAERMPPCARALTGPPPASPPSAIPVPLLRSFLAMCVDHLVRSAAVGDRLASADRSVSAGRPIPARRPVAARRSDPASVHEAWLYALRSPEATVRGTADELTQLEWRVKEWHGPLALTENSPYRLCLRLEEPGATGTAGLPESDEACEPGACREEPTWYVRYLLQASDDPSLLVPLVEAWSPVDAGKVRKSPLGFQYLNWNPNEYLFAWLGQAAGLCPEVAASLEAGVPAGYALDTRGAYEFLTERAAALEESGFGVMLPAWWTRRGTKTKLRVRARVRSPRMRSGGALSLEHIAEVEWSVALGDATVTPDELERLAGLKAPLVRLRGQWVELNTSEIQAAVDFWKRRANGRLTVRDVLRMGVGAERAPAGLELDGVEADGWVGDLLGRLGGRGKLRELAAPRGFSGALRPYQVRGYSWLAFLRRWGLGACLADDMGLGKTVQTLALIQHDWEANGPDRRPVLLVCPTSVVDNWRKEAARFTPALPVMVHHGLGRRKDKTFERAAESQAIVISSYALLHRDIELFRAVDWAGVVLDEAQNIKNPETKQARAARAVRAGYRVALTGTPVENHIGELRSIMEFLNPGLLGKQADFKREFFVPIQAERDTAATERLRRITGPFILRRVKTDRSIITDLPDKQETRVFCRLTREQASLYAAVLKETEEALEEAEGIGRKGLILATLSKLKQVCNHPAQFLGDNSPISGRSGKLARLTELLEEVLEAGDKALVFTQFAEMGEILRRHLREAFGREVLFLHGGVPRKRRDEMVERFQGTDAAEGPPIFVLSLKAGGTGLNLTAANHVFHFDRWWNPAVEDQATDRVFRIGQRRGVMVHKFVCAGTLEERIDEMIERKREVAETVVGAGEAWLTELSDRELRDIFALRAEAVD